MGALQRPRVEGVARDRAQHQVDHDRVSTLNTPVTTLRTPLASQWMLVTALRTHRSLSSSTLRDPVDE